jgi:hypothetical protein
MVEVMAYFKHEVFTILKAAAQVFCHISKSSKVSPCSHRRLFPINEPDYLMLKITVNPVVNQGSMA